MTLVTAGVRAVGYKAPVSSRCDAPTLKEPAVTRSIALIAAAFALTVGAAHAQEASVHINAGKLNLNNAADARFSIGN